MISQKMIAQKLGMPTSTVANILNGTPHYKKETRERVLKAAKELGYQPNRASLALKRGRSNLVGVIHFGSTYSTAHQGIHHAVQSLREYGYDHLVVDSHWHSGDSDRVLSEIIQSRVEAVLLIANTKDSPGPVVLRRLKTAGIPIVSLFGEVRSEIPLVVNSTPASFAAMLRHLQGIGHRKILIILPASDELSVLARHDGFVAGMEGVGPCYTFRGDEFFTEWPRLRKECSKDVFGVIARIDVARYAGDIRQANYELAKSLFAFGALPDAIMCTNDRGATGVFNAAYEMNIRIPADVAVTGCDNEEICTFPMFRLSSVKFDIASSARAAVQMLMKMLTEHPLPSQDVTIPSDLVLRQSCGRMVGPDGPEINVRIEQPPTQNVTFAPEIQDSLVVTQ